MTVGSSCAAHLILHLALQPTRVWRNDMGRATYEFEDEQRVRDAVRRYSVTLKAILRHADEAQAS